MICIYITNKSSMIPTKSKIAQEHPDWLTTTQNGETVINYKANKKEIYLMEKQNKRLAEKIQMNEKALKIKKLHLQEYLNEIEQMRNKIINLEEIN